MCNTQCIIFICLFYSQLYKRQGLVSLELFQTIVCHGDIREPSLFSLATKLWGLAQKHGELDTKIMVIKLKINFDITIIIFLIHVLNFILINLEFTNEQFIKILIVHVYNFFHKC